MANHFKMKAATLSTTNNTDLITVAGSSVFLVSSIIIANRTVGTDTTADLKLYDASETATFYILNDEPFPAKISKEILSRPMVLEVDDILQIQVADANAIDILISYLDRDRN